MMRFGLALLALVAPPRIIAAHDVDELVRGDLGITLAVAETIADLARLVGEHHDALVDAH